MQTDSKCLKMKAESSNVVSCGRNGIGNFTHIRAENIDCQFKMCSKLWAFPQEHEWT